MTQRYPGGFVTKTPPTLNPALGNSTPGVWTLDQVMQNIKAGTWPAYDPYFEYTTLLLHGNGTNGAQNNTFLDSSTNNFTITRNGNTTQGTFTPYGSNWSNNFGGSTNYYLTIPSGQTPLNLSTGDFTVECWVNLTDITNLSLVLTVGSTGWQLGYESARKLYVYNGGNIMTSSTAITIGTWNHFAWTRSGTTMYLYLNGVQVATASNSSSVDLNGAYIAAYAGGTSSYPFYGSMSNLRIVKGTAVYTGAFTPPTSPLTAITNTSLLTCQSNRFIDNSSNAFAITVTGSPSVQRFSPFNPSAPYAAGTIGGSGYFDGTTSSLVTTNNVTTIGTQDFCLEAWVYCLSTTNYACIIGTDGVGCFIEMGTLRGIFLGGPEVSMGSVIYNQWVHLAYCRVSGTYAGYVNGVRQVTGTYSSNLSTAVKIGINNYAVNSISGYGITGYIANPRMVVGSSPYSPSSTTITVPTSPLTAVTNTLLLVNMTNGGIIDNTMMNDLQTVGNAQISTTQSKFGGASMYFDGSTDYLTSPQSVNIDLPGDFTVECWIYFGSVSGTSAIVGKWGGSGAYAWVLQYISGTGLRFYTGVSGGLGTSIAGAWTPSTGVWYHIAVSRSSGSVRLFVNGSQVGTTTTNTDNCTTSNQALNIGRNADTNIQYLNGYIDDLRITKGYARYTANFTPQTSQWQDQ